MFGYWKGKKKKKKKEEEEEPKGNWWENMPQEEEEDSQPQRKRRHHGEESEKDEEEKEKETHKERQRERARKRREQQEKEEREREEERKREEEREREEEEREQREREQRQREKEQREREQREREQREREQREREQREREQREREERERIEREKAMKPPPPKEEVTALFARLKPHIQNIKRFPKAVDALMNVITDGSILKTPYAISLFLDVLCAAGEHIEAKKLMQEEPFRALVKRLFVSSQVVYDQMDSDQKVTFEALLLRSKTAFELFSDDSMSWSTPIIQIKKAMDDLKTISCPETKKLASKSVMICLEIAFAHRRKPSIKPCVMSLVKHAYGIPQQNSLLDHPQIAKWLGALEEGTGRGVGIRGGTEKGSGFEKKAKDWGGAAVSKRGCL